MSWKSAITVVVVAGLCIAAGAWAIRVASATSEPSPTEVRKITADRVFVERWIGRCLALSETRQAPADLKLDLGIKSASAAATIDPAQIHPAYYRIASMSNALAERRVAFDIHWGDAFIRAEIATWASVLVGLLTTVFVALTSTSLVDKATNKGAWISITALALPAFGTAVAAVVAFYEPGALLASRKSQAAAAEQLHLQIGQGVWKMACFKSADEPLSDQQVALFDTWSQRFQELVLRADAKSGSTGGASGGSGKP